MTTRPRRPGLSLAVSALSCLLLSADTPDASALDFSLPADQYVHETWTTRDGLPEGRILSLVAASDGYLWIGTPNGICRFDGIRFRSSALGELGLGPPDVAWELRQGEDGAVWTAFRGGVARFSGGRLDFFDAARGPQFVHSMAPGPAGSLWIGSGKTGVWQLRDGVFSRHPAYRAPGLPFHVRALAVDRRGVLWVATEEGIVELGAQPRRYGVADGLGSPMVNALL